MAGSVVVTLLVSMWPMNCLLQSLVLTVKSYQLPLDFVEMVTSAGDWVNFQGPP